MPLTDDELTTRARDLYIALKTCVVTPTTLDPSRAGWMAAIQRRDEEILAAIFAALQAVREESQPHWIAVTERMPENGVTVLVCWRNKVGKSRTSRAAFFAAGTLEVDDDFAFGDLNEDGTIAEDGWFEVSDTREPVYWHLVEPVTHWQPLPKGPA